MRGTIEEALEWTENEEIRGEFCLIIEGNEGSGEEDEPQWWISMGMKEHVQHYIDEEGLAFQRRIKQIAKDRNLPKREVYQAYPY